MSKLSGLVYDAPRGAPIKAFNILGPYDFDVSQRINGLTWFEDQRLTNGLDVYKDIISEAAPIMQRPPRENDEQTLFGIPSRWHFLRVPEDVTAFGLFHVYNCFGAVLAHTVLDAGEDTKAKFMLVSRSTACLTVSFDGKIVFDSNFGIGEPDAAGNPYRDFFFEADLKKGGSDVMICVSKMCRWTNVGFGLFCQSHDIAARTALQQGVAVEDRQKLEDAIQSVELERELFYEGEKIAVTAEFCEKGFSATARLAGDGVNLEFKLKSGRNEILTVDESLPEGTYKLFVTISDTALCLSAENEYTVYRTVLAPQLPGRQHFEERRQYYLNRLASKMKDGMAAGLSALYIVCANYMKGIFSPVMDSIIKIECDTMRERRDCSDFRMQPLMRLLYWEARQHRLSDETVAYMKETVLGFKYWQDEPGNTVMYFSSENHRLLFHVAEYLAGQLYPLETFTNSQQNGLYHTNKARAFIVHWLQERGRYGFTEYHSNSYFSITLSPLLNLWEFVHPDDVQLRLALKQVIDYMTLMLAANTFRGAMATAHSRTYAPAAKHPELESPFSLNYLLFGNGGIMGVQGFAVFEVASGPYRPPEIFYDMAEDNENRQFFTWQQSRSPDGVSPTFGIYRTPYYQMSAMFDSMQKGKSESAMHTAHVGLPRNISVFFSAPWAVSETNGLRPSYWSGTAITPRTAQKDNVMAVMFKGYRYNWETHCFFEKARFDRVELRGNWAFAEVDGAYIGIWCDVGLSFNQTGLFRNRELISHGIDATWVCQCGDVQSDGDFDSFMKKLEAAKVCVCDGKLSYDAPGVGLFQMGWDGPVTVNGDALKLRRLPTVTSDWINGEFGDPHLVINYNGDIRDLWMD